MLRIFSWLCLVLAAPGVIAEAVVLQKNEFEHIHFRRIQPTIVSFGDAVINFDVHKSSSFLLQAFDEIRPVSAVSFEWKASGMLNKSSRYHEKTRAGDDAWLRVGLIISGEPELVPEPLLPRWVIKVRNTLKHPSDRMIYLIPDAQHDPGESWKSPFSSNIDMIAIDSEETGDGWNQARYVFAEPRQAVGLWIMADGDNTASIFNSQIRNLVLE